MPRPITEKRSNTLVAGPTTSLADALGMSRPDLQEAAREQQAANCTAAPTPIPEPDVESEGGLSEAEQESDLDSVLRRDILHDRQHAFQAAVAPVSCTTAAIVAPRAATDHNNDNDDDDNDDVQSVATQPASVVDHDPSALLPFHQKGEEVPESHVSTAAGTAANQEEVAGADGYTEEDWDRPVGQTNYWYDNQVNGIEEQPMFFPAATEPQSQPEVHFHHPHHHDNDYYNDDNYHHYGPQQGDGEGEYFDVEQGPSPRQETEPTSFAPTHTGDSDQYLQYQQRYLNHTEAVEQPPVAVEEAEDEAEDEQEFYNPDCNCDACIRMFTQQLRKEVTARWGHRFPHQHDHHDHAHCDHAHQHQPQQQQRRMTQPQKKQSHQHNHQHEHNASFETHNGSARQSGSLVAAPRSVQQQQTAAALYDSNGKPKHARGSKGGNPFAVVACCYFKQKGFCKMGADCWYSHDADESTPCHYGALCKAAGHRQLVKGNNANSTGSSAPAADVAPFAAHPTMANMSSVVPRVQPTVPATKVIAAPRPAATLVPSVAPCAFCGAHPANVRTQSFPVFHGTTRTVAQRAHCTQCLRTYAL